MHLRRAIMDDALDVLAWRNDPDTIAMSKTPGMLDRASHLRWFEAALADPNREIYIATENGQKLGMVQFDRSDDAWVVSINIAPKERSKGYGRAILRRAIDAVRESKGSCRLSAEIKEGNTASLQLFEQCGFVRADIRAGLHHLALDQ